ncbi:hypothetical protein ACTGY9_12205, partial [Streptococcus suis]
LPDAEVEAALATNAGWLAERYPMLTRAVLDGLIAEARDKGYGFNRGLLFPGSWGIGMVVRDAQGRPDGCLSLAAIESGPSAGRPESRTMPSAGTSSAPTRILSWRSIRTTRKPDRT